MIVVEIVLINEVQDVTMKIQIYIETGGNHMAVQKIYGLTYEQMEEFIKTVNLPIGQELYDRRTYRIEPLYYLDLDQKFRKLVAYYSKVLILSDGLDHPIGAVFFDGASSLIMYMLQEHRDQKNMATICQNGILRSECYPYQAVQMPIDDLESYEYFQKIHHLLLCCGLRINNLDSCFGKLLEVSPEVEGCYTENGYSSFMAAYGVDGAYERLAPGEPMSIRLARSTNLILYDNRTVLTEVTDDHVVFDYRPAKNLNIRMQSVGSDVMLGLFSIDATIENRGKKVPFFQSDNASEEFLSQHVPWSQLPEFLKQFMAVFDRVFTKRSFVDNPGQMMGRFEHELKDKFEPVFFEYIRDFR